MTGIMTATTNDALDILRHVAGLQRMSAERAWQLDLDQNNITTADALKILEGLAGLAELAPIPPLPEPLEPLSQEMELRIKADRIEQLLERTPVHLLPEEGFSIDGVLIFRYFGTYSDSVTLIIEDAYTRTAGFWEAEIAGYNFEGSRSIMVWNDGQFYSLCKAYDEGFLTTEDIKTIHFYFNTHR